MYGKPFVRPKKTSRFFVSSCRMVKDYVQNHWPMYPTMRKLHFLAGHHLHAAIDDIDFVELRVADMTAHVDRVRVGIQVVVVVASNELR